MGVDAVTQERQDGQFDVSGSKVTQNREALAKNRDWFANSDWHKTLVASQSSVHVPVPLPRHHVGR